MKPDSAEWFDLHPDPRHVAREREKARVLRASEWWKAQLRAGKCHYCGRTFPPEELTMDHIVPVARGGRSVRGNVVPACRACNAAKKFLTPAEQILRDLNLPEPEPPEPGTPAP